MKSICGPCVRKEKLCEHASTSRRSASSPAANGDASSGIPRMGPQLKLPRNQSGSNELLQRRIISLHRLVLLCRSLCPLDYMGTLTWLGRLQRPTSAHVHLLCSTIWQEVILAQIRARWHWQHTHLSPSNASFTVVRCRSGQPAMSTFPQSRGNEGLSIENLGDDGLAQTNVLQSATQALDSLPTTQASHDPIEDGPFGPGHREESSFGGLEGRWTFYRQSRCYLSISFIN